MNVTLPEKEKISKKRITLYIVSLIICILAIIIVISVQILGNEVIDSIFGISKLVNRTEQEEIELKSNFESSLDNTLKGKEKCNVQKSEKDKDIVFTNYTQEEKSEDYEISVNLPYINLKSTKVEKFNNDIIEIFKEKSEKIIQNAEDNNIVYTVKYAASIENDILSLIIYSNLKQATDAQRVIIQTFNYNLENDSELSLQDVLKIYDVDKNAVQNKIEKDMKEQEKKANELKELGYNVYSRNISDNKYKVENVTEFFIYNGNIFIVFAYGNEELTSEMDLVII